MAEEARDVLDRLVAATGRDEDLRLLLAAADAKLVASCLSEAGVDFQPPSPAEAPGTDPVLPSVAELWLHSSGTIGFAQALTEPGVLDSLQQQPHDQPATQPPPEGYESAYFGDPPEYLTVEFPNGLQVQRPIGGCAGQVTEEMYGVEAEQYERAYAALPRLEDVLLSVVGRPDLGPAVEAWSSCMRRHGFELESPGSIADVVGQRMDQIMSGAMSPDDVRALDAELSQSDLSCKAESRLLSVFAPAFIAESNDVLRETEGVLVAYEGMLEHAREVAANVVVAEAPS